MTLHYICPFPVPDYQAPAWMSLPPATHPMARQSHTGAAGRWSRRTTLLGKTTSLPFTLVGDSGVAINPLAGQDTKPFYG